jgi:hypothetical protein
MTDCYPPSDILVNQLDSPTLEPCTRSSTSSPSCACSCFSLSFRIPSRYCSRAICRMLRFNICARFAGYEGATKSGLARASLSAIASRSRRRACLSARAFRISGDSRSGIRRMLASTSADGLEMTDPSRLLDRTFRESLRLAPPTREETGRSLRFRNGLLLSFSTGERI